MSERKLSLGFDDAVLPSPGPLKHSASANGIEADLNKLFCALFDEAISRRLFDANVSGAAHLGSLDLVRRAINRDGLVLMQGDREEPSTRYVYKAWKSENGQGRGLHFLRTYLQALFPNLCDVNQLWQDKNHDYPYALYTNKPHFSWWLKRLGEPGLKLDGSWALGRPVSRDEGWREHRAPSTEGLFLTSRVEIELDLSVDVRSIENLMDIIRSIIPARLVPHFKFVLRMFISVHIRSLYALKMQKKVDQRYPWCGRVVTDSVQHKWKLGKDGEAVKLPQPFGSFKLGEVRGGKSSWRLKNCRIDSGLSLHKKEALEVYGHHKLKKGKLVNGSWKLGRRSIAVLPYTEAKKKTTVSVPITPAAAFIERHVIDFPNPVHRLGAKPRLSPWRKLDSTWKVGQTSRPFGFPLNQRGVRVLSACSVSLASSAVVTPHRKPRLAPPTKLDGSWAVGGTPDIVVGNIDLVKKSIETSAHIKADSSKELKAFHDIAYPESPTKLGRIISLGEGRLLDGSWGLGQALIRTPLGFKLRKDKGIEIESESKMIVSASTRVSPIRLSGISLNGSWRVGGEARPGFKFTRIAV